MTMTRNRHYIVVTDNAIHSSTGGRTMKGEFFNTHMFFSQNTDVYVYLNFRNNRNSYLLHSRVLVKSSCLLTTVLLHYFLL